MRGGQQNIYIYRRKKRKTALHKGGGEHCSLAPPPSVHVCVYHTAWLNDTKKIEKLNAKAVSKYSQDKYVFFCEKNSVKIKASISKRLVLLIF